MLYYRHCLFFICVKSDEENREYFKDKIARMLLYTAQNKISSEYNQYFKNNNPYILAHSNMCM